jgi:transcriptional regulator with XRE-family HTH domain
MDGAKKETRDARLRELLRDLKENHYKSNAALARALGVEPPTVTEILNSKRGVGLELLEAIADLTGRSLDDLCGRAPARTGTLAAHGRWTAARADAERQLGHVRADVLRAALDRVGQFALPQQPVVLTGLFVARLAEAVIANPQEF